MKEKDLNYVTRHFIFVKSFFWHDFRQHLKEVNWIVWWWQTHQTSENHLCQWKVSLVFETFKMKNLYILFLAYLKYSILTFLILFFRFTVICSVNSELSITVSFSIIWIQSFSYFFYSCKKQLIFFVIHFSWC